MNEQEAMIESMRRYRAVKAELEEQAARGKEYIEQVKEEVAADLWPLEEELERLKDSMQTFIREERAGEKFRVPGLGTVFITVRRRTTVAQEGAFAAWATKHLSDEDLDCVFPRTFKKAAANTIAAGHLQKTGELLPGVEHEETESLSVRLSGKESS